MSTIKRGRLAYWLVPLAILACSATFQACGDENANCGDLEILPSQASCDSYGDQFNCANADWDADICTVSGCICQFVIDDMDDF